MVLSYLQETEFRANLLRRDKMALTSKRPLRDRDGDLDCARGCRGKCHSSSPFPLEPR